MSQVDPGGRSQVDPLSEPDLLEGTVALRGGTLSILSLCQSEGCCRQEAHVCGLWLAVSFCFHGY